MLGNITETLSSVNQPLPFSFRENLGQNFPEKTFICRTEVAYGYGIQYTQRILHRISSVLCQDVCSSQRKYREHKGSLDWYIHYIYHNFLYIVYIGIYIILSDTIIYIILSMRLYVPI